MGNLYNFLQKQVFPQKTLAICLLLLLSFFSQTVLAQTPGLIIRKGNVTGGAPSATVLNPSGSGWTSTSTSGFVSNDITESEIAYQPVPTPSGEDPINDIRRGPAGGFSEIISGPGDSGLFFFSDGTNLLFRLRIAGLVAGSKGYSVLIDSDGKFGNSGPNADPNWTASNPGFEYEIIYESNFRVAIYRIDGGTTPTLLVPAYNLDTNPDHAQISVALPNSPSPPDYFYDWYVPISAFAAEPGAIAITASSPLRMVATTVMAPKPAINGPASDIQGDDTEFKNPLDQWSNIINAQSGTAPDGSTGPNLLCTAPTRLTGPIAPEASSISGIWTSSSSVTTATIEVFRIRTAVTTSLGTTSATSAATWTLSGLSTGDVADGDVIYATAQGTGEGICGQSNSVLVQDCNTETTTGVPSITAFTNSGATGTKTLGTTLRIYRVNADGTRTLLASGREGETTWGWAGDEIVLTNPASPNPSSSGGTRTPSGTYVVTQQAPGECESIGVFSACITGVGGAIIQTAQPVITQATITEESTTLSGTAASGSTVRLFISGIQVATATATGGNYSFSLGSYFLQSGQTVSVRAQTTGECLSAADTRTVVLSPVFCDLSSPFISNNGDGQIQAGSAISGVSSEAVGTEITVYNASTNAVIGTTTVIAGGTWSLAGPAVAGTTYFARHFTTACGFSNPSNTVTALAASTASCGTITGPVLQTATIVAGTGYSPASTVRLFIDGAEIGDATVDIDGEWEIPVSPSGPNAIYPGGVLTTTVENVGQLPLSCTLSSVTVDCVPPDTPLVSTSTPLTVNFSSFSVTISNSELGVLYYLVDAKTDAGLGQTLGTQRGTSLFGNGGSLTLTSSSFISVDGTYEFVVSANPLSASACTEQSAMFQVEKVSVVEAILPDFAVTKINTQVSGNVSSNDVLLGTITYSNATGSLPGATLTLNSDGTYDFVATATGVYVYEINVCADPTVPPACPTSFLTITVTDPTIATNPPVANPDVYPVLQGQTLTGNILDNDVDLSGTGLIVTALNGTAFTTSETVTNYGGSGGDLEINDDGTFTLTNPTNPGTYTFTYTLCDQDSPQICALPVTVTIEVYPTGTANIVYANDDYANISQGGTATGNLLTNDIQLTGAAITAATPKTETVAGVGTFVVLANGNFTFTPVATFNGSHQFTYEALGASGASAIGTFHVTVEPFLVNPDIAVAYKGETISGNASTNDVVPAGSTYTTATVIMGGTLNLATDGSYTFVATAVGLYTYDIEVCAPTTPPGCATKTLTITVTDPTIATNLPVANSDIAVTYADANPANTGVPVTINALANDEAGNPTNELVASTAALVGTPVGVVNNGDGTFTYTPAAGFTGTFTFQYTVEDNEGRESEPATVSVTVYPAGTPNVVVASDDYGTTLTGSPLSNNAANGLLANDSQLDGATALVATDGTFTNAGEGTLVLATDGSYSFTPAAGFVGTTSFVYTVTGTDGATASGTAYFTVSSILVPDINVGFIDVSIPGDLSTNDLVATGTTYGSIVADGGNPNTNVPVLAADGTYTFITDTPGVYNFTYEICSPIMTSPACDTGTLSITVTDPGIITNLPTANNDVATTVADANPANPGVPVAIDVLANDQVGNAGGTIDATTVTIGTAPTNGSTSINATTGVITYTPAAGFVGTDTFTYTVDDSDGRTSAPATVTVTVYPASSPNVLIAADDYYTGLSTSAISTGNVLNNDTQIIGGAVTTLSDPGTFTLSGGELTLNADGTFSFIPNPTFQGVTTHTYTAEGTNGATGTATIYFTVYGDLIINPDINVAFKDETISGNASTNDVAPAGSTYTTATVIMGATLNLAADGSYTFDATAVGVYTYAIEVCAPTTPPGCETKTLTITVTDPAVTTNPPVANNDIAVTLVDVAVAIDVASNDKAGNNGGTIDPTTVAIGTAPTNGSTSINATTGVITYTPDASFTGTDTFTYTIDDTDGNGPSTGTVTVTVYPAGTPNVVLAADDYFTTNGIAPVGGNVLTNDTQLSGATLTTVTNPGTYSVAGKGSLVLNANGTFTFTPVAGAEGVASFVYTVQGTDGATASATLYLSVYPPVTYTWTGATDDDWCDPTNWDRGAVPVAGVNVTIPSTANDPVFDFSSCPVCINDLTIANGVTVGLTGKLCVTGDLDSQGNVIGAGSISLEGTTPQTITGQFNINNLELNNLTGGATITSGAGNMVNITESIKLTAGTLTTNDNLRLVSDASGDAYFAPISDAECLVVNIVGNVRVQKFVDGGNRAFRFIAHPFNGTLSLQQVRDYVHITGSGLDFNSTGNPSAFWYVTASGNQAEEGDDTGWVPVSSTNIGEWFKGRAVRMLFRGPRIQGGVVGDDNYVPQDVTYELIGSVNLCEQILVGLRRVGTPGDLSGAAGNSAFNFIGNPYPAAINLKTIPAGDRTNIGANYYLWQPRTGVASGDVVFGIGAGRGGSYFPEPFGSGPAERGQLAIGTGFFVVANVDLATIRFTEANKLSQKQLDPSAAVTFRTDDEIKSSYGANTFQLAIHINGEMVDRVLMFFDENTSGKVDIMDATKFENPLINFFTVSEDDYAMAIDRRPWVAEGEYRIPLHILSPAVKYTLTVPDFDMESGRELHLYDRHLDKLIRLAKGATYEFEVTAEQATKGHRFDIVMGVEVITSIGKNADRFQAFLLPNPAQQQVLVSIQRPDEIADTHVRLLDVKGVVLYQSTIKADDDAQINYELGSLAKGVYLVEITHGKQRIVKRLMVN